MFVGVISAIIAAFLLGVISGSVIQKHKQKVDRHRISLSKIGDKNAPNEDEYDEDDFSFFDDVGLEIIDLPEDASYSSKPEELSTIDNFVQVLRPKMSKRVDQEFEPVHKPEKREHVEHEKNNTDNVGHEINGIELSKEQYEVFLRLVDTNDNYFITGEAGTGKSVLLQYFMKNSRKAIAVVAPTGIAALNVGGQTIHSLFRLPPQSLDVHDKALVRNMSRNQKAMFQMLQVLVIDEISMVRSDVMDMIDAKLKYARDSDEPFGGCQIIAFGDLYQLPPVAKAQVSRFFIDRYRTTFFFGASAVVEKPFRIIELKENHRQHDAHFLAALNQIRIGKNDPDVLESINSGAVIDASNSNRVMTVTTTKAAADRLNDEALSSLPGEEHIYKGEKYGKFNLNDGDLPTALELHLKVGAKVMFLVNDHSDENKGSARWVNGTIGEIAELTDDIVMVKVNGVCHSIDKYTWVKYEYHYDADRKELSREAIGSFTQYPLKLYYYFRQKRLFYL